MICFKWLEKEKYLTNIYLYRALVSNDLYKCIWSDVS